MSTRSTTTPSCLTLLTINSLNVSEWFENQKKPSSNSRKFLKERIEKANPRRNLTAEEAKRLAKLEAIGVAIDISINIKTGVGLYLNVNINLYQ